MAGDGWRVGVAIAGVCGLLIAAPAINAIGRISDYEITPEALAQWAAVAVSLAALIVSIWALVLLRGTLRAAMEANVGFSRSSERQLRAYLSAKPTNFRIDVDVKASFPQMAIVAITVQVKNHGQTPAAQTQVWANILYEPWPMPSKFWKKYPESLTHRAVIRPGEEHTFNFEKPIAFDPVGLYETPARRFVLTGVVRYTDAFGNERYARFTGSITNMRDWWHRVRNGEMPNLNFEHAEEGNEAD